jgi:DtxR family Mn-dependent transcriptional regulator
MRTYHLSEAVEDYLKAIYELTENDDRASTNQVATNLQVASSSATSMLQKMAAFDPPLVEYQKHHGVSLTGPGRAAALEIIRHHRLLEVFLRKTLGYSWDEVHAEADRLEHYISEEMETRIANLLDNPTTDPHGSPIPTSDFQIPSRYLVKSSSALPLSDLRPGQSATIIQVDDSDPSFLKYLGKIGLFPETPIKILDYSPFDGNLAIQIHNQAQTLVLGPGITCRISVAVIPGIEP